MFTLKQLALPGIERPPNEVNSSSAKPSTLMKVPILKGPIPLPWLMTTACLPGKTLEVGIALWFLSGVKKNYEVVLSNKLLMSLGSTDTLNTVPYGQWKKRALFQFSKSMDEVL